MAIVCNQHVITKAVAAWDAFYASAE